MVTNIMAVTYIWNLFSIKHCWLHILVKFGTSIANMKYMKILQFWHSLYGPNVSDNKNGYFGGSGNLESIMLLWLPIFRW